LNGTPKLLGFIPQGFRIYGGRMASAPLVALSTLGPRVIDFVWKPLQEAYGLSTKERPTKLKLGEVQDLGVLVTKSQEQGRPIWNVEGGNADSKAQSQKLFADIAKRVIEATA
jgi:hypothetical protein